MLRIVVTILYLVHVYVSVSKFAYVFIHLKQTSCGLISQSWIEGHKVKIVLTN